MGINILDRLRRVQISFQRTSATANVLVFLQKYIQHIYGFTMKEDMTIALHSLHGQMSCIYLLKLKELFINRCECTCECVCSPHSKPAPILLQSSNYYYYPSTSLPYQIQST
jgi:hypothetical protein